jgi:hypothetical protein
MLENGIRSIRMHDRDFRRFRSIEVVDPFAGPSQPPSAKALTAFARPPS